MNYPWHPNNKLDLACLRRGYVSLDRGIPVAPSNWHAREAAARARALSPHDQRLGSISKWP